MRPINSSSRISVLAVAFVIFAARAQAGPIFLTGHDPDFHAQSSVGVRFTDGFHFCTAPDYAARGCVGAQYQAGERRASAAVAAGIIDYFETSPTFNPPT